jgi:hypothetical protein
VLRWAYGFFAQGRRVVGDASCMQKSTCGHWRILVGRQNGKRHRPVHARTRASERSGQLHTVTDCVSGRSGKPAGAARCPGNPECQPQPPAGWAVRRGLGAKHATRPRAIAELMSRAPWSSLGRGTPRSFRRDGKPYRRWRCPLRHALKGRTNAPCLSSVR